VLVQQTEVKQHHFLSTDVHPPRLPALTGTSSPSLECCCHVWDVYRDTSCFSSDDASGSTSQAASIQELLEVGATCLLMDEDTCATNFMMRDVRMAALVSADKEPITPFVQQIR
jgi:hypothetical protein